MKLPRAEEAIVEKAKLLNYLLNPEHPVGRHHAYLFERLLGYNTSNSEALREALLTAAVVEEVNRETTTEHGWKYEMDFALEGPLGTKLVRAVWIIESGSSSPRLVTCYVKD